MMATNPTTKKRTGTPTNPRNYLGRDAEGYDHVILRDERRVVRLDESGIERSIDLGDVDDVRYREWVENQVGWQTRDTLIPVDIMAILGGDAE